LYNALGKLTSKIIADRLTAELCDRHILHAANEGFLIGKGTHNALNTILNLREDARENNKEMYNMLYDVSGAYDAIPHETIKRGMKILHIPEKTQNYIMNQMKQSTVMIKTKYGMTKAFRVRKGVAQGCPLSPIVYIIAMNPLHVGIEKNPLHGGRQDGYVMLNRERGEQTKIGSKGYADDTAVMSGSIEGMERITEWVNYFCIKNRISMNKTKSLLFGRDKRGEDMKTAFEIVRQGKQAIEEGEVATWHQGDGTHYTKYAIQPIPADSMKIKYLGIRMNMDITWEKQIAEMGSMVGLHTSVANANKLTAEMTTFLFNKYLKPKLEYRMQFVEIKKKKLEEWDKLINRTISNKINEKYRTRTEAMQVILGVEWPSDYYKTVQATALERALNDDTDMGQTSRIRMGREEEQETGDWQLSKFQRMMVKINPGLRTVYRKEQGADEYKNRVRKQRKIIKDLKLEIEKNQKFGQEIPTGVAPGVRWKTTRVRGRQIGLPEDHYGVWGSKENKQTISVATDGSLSTGEDGRKEKAGWSMVILNDWFEKNWSQLHEDNHELHRKRLIQEHLIHWGGVIDEAESSYKTELVALIKAMMIIPETWDIEWVTDSESTIRTFEGIDRMKKTDVIKNNWDLVEMLQILKKRRKGKVTPVHQHSHRKEHNRNSVANATADILADYYTLELQGYESGAQIPSNCFSKRYVLRGTGDRKRIVEPLRRKLRKT
jgi:hypothetical protein